MLKQSAILTLEFSDIAVIPREFTEGTKAQSLGIMMT